jgi:hypothetical protein
LARKTSAIVAVKVRLRESLRRKIEGEADKRKLSVNKEIERRLELSFAEQDMQDLVRDVASATAVETNKALWTQLNMIFALLNRPDLMVKVADPKKGQ